MADSPEEMILALLGFAAFALVLLLIQVARSNSGNGDASGDIVHIDDLRDVAVLSQLEEFDVGFWRQSSEIYKWGSACTSRGQALKELQSTFRRAKIDFVRIKRNNIDELDVWRASHGARGVREGKKLGGQLLRRLLSLAKTEKNWMNLSLPLRT